MPFTIHQSDDHTWSTSGRFWDYNQNGNLWYVHRTSGSIISFYYSTDGGTTWNLASTNVNTAVSTGGALAQSVAFFIDKDDYAHLLYYGTAVVAYRRGTPNAGRTNYTWTSEVSVHTPGGYGITYGGLDIVAHREDTGWRAHCVWLENQPGDGWGLSRLATMSINSGGTISRTAYGSVFQWGYNVGGYHSIDFRHTAEDPKAVQASTPHLYMALTTSDAAQALYFDKFNYSGGNWSQDGGAGSATLIDSNAIDDDNPPQLFYDGTRIVVAYVRQGTNTVVRCLERNEANNLTTPLDPTALSDGVVGHVSCGYDNDQNIHIVAQGQTSDDYQRIRYNRNGAAWAGSWTVVEASAATGVGGHALSVQRGIQPITAVYNQLGVVYANLDTSPNSIKFATVHIATFGEANLQGVATSTADANTVSGGEGALQSVATLAAEGQFIAGPQSALQGIARMSAQAEGVPRLDFTVYDAYIEAGGEVRGLLFYDEQKPETVSRKLEPTRQDVGNNPDEIRPDFGNFFAQSDMSHGSGQMYFHQPGRDPKKVFHLEGFDISEPGRLFHLHAIAEAHNSATVGAIAQAGDLPFVIDGQGVRAGNGSFPGSWTNEDPSGADADQNVNDLIAEGARLFAAINTATASVRVRSSGGAWSRFQVGGTDLSVGIATHLAWVKSRLMVIGGTNSREIYEVAATATPVAIETLPEGWSFESIFEAGGMIHACAVNPAAGLSRVHHYGLNTGATAIEKKSSTPWPQGQLMYVGCGFPGLAFIAGGRRTSAGGYDPILYRAQLNELGEMNYIEVREEEGSGAADLSVRAIIASGETILVGWSLASGAYGGARDGIAIYHIARDAFALHLRKTAGGGNQRVASIMPYKGRILISITGDGLYYEDLATYIPTATMVTSLADWNNAGLKVWDFVEISHDPLVAGTSFDVEYDTQTHELATWNALTSSNIVGSQGATGRLSNVKAPKFALRITSNVSGAISPAFLGYSVRSLPAPALPEFQLTRYIRLLSKDSKDEDAPPVAQDPRELLFFLQDALYSFITFYESGANWTAWLEDASTVEPEQPFYETTGGEALKDAFVVRLQMTGTR